MPQKSAAPTALFSVGHGLGRFPRLCIDAQQGHHLPFAFTPRAALTVA